MEGNSIKSFENLCKIFEIRIKLDRENNKKASEEVLTNYEKYLKKIDSFYNKEFEEDIRLLITPELTLEDEQKRLKKLIKLLEERLEKRIKLEDDYYKATGKNIKNFQMIISDEELDSKKERLNIITRYLETKNDIESVSESIINLKKSLSEEEEKKEEYISKNRMLEDELYSVFIEVIKDVEYYRDINEENIKEELDNLLEKVRETKETLDITKESIISLTTNGLEEDYSSYIDDAEKNYYVWKDRELVIGIYNLIVNFEEEFNDISRKRNQIKELLEERQALRKKLNINDIDIMFNFEKLVFQQIKVLDNEKEILENISNYTSRIKFKEDRLSELEEVNNSVEILTILSEYGLIDTYDTEEIEISEEEETIKEEEEPIIKQVYDPYRIVEVKDYPKTLNIGLAKLKGESIRDKVNKKLNPVVEEKTFKDLTINLDEEKKEEFYASPDAESIPVWEFALDTASKEIDKPKESISNSKIQSIPEWKAPLNLPVEEKENKEENISVWEKPLEPLKEEPVKKKEDILPVWDVKITEDKPMPEEVVNIEIMSKQPELKEVTIDNMFWIPVSEDKLETNQFPNINIPIQNKFTNKDDNFGFPDIK